MPSRPLKQLSDFYIYFTAQADKAEQAAIEARAVVLKLRDEGPTAEEMEKFVSKLKISLIKS